MAAIGVDQKLLAGSLDDTIKSILKSNDMVGGDAWLLGLAAIFRALEERHDEALGLLERARQLEPDAPFLRAIEHYLHT